MKFKKITALTLAFLSLATVGCNSTKNNATNTSNEEIVTEITNPVEITFWHAMNGNLETSLKIE